MKCNVIWYELCLKLFTDVVGKEKEIRTSRLMYYSFSMTLTDKTCIYSHINLINRHLLSIYSISNPALSMFGI